LITEIKAIYIFLFCGFKLYDLFYIWYPSDRHRMANINLSASIARSIPKNDIELHLANLYEFLEKYRTSGVKSNRVEL